MKRKIMLMLFCGASVSLAASGNAWTLENCIKQARSASLSVESAKLSERSAVASLDQARDSRYPDLSASINQTLYDSPFNSASQDHYRLSLGLTGSMTLWDGGATGLTIESRSLDLQASRYNTDLAAMKVTESVMNAYISLLASMEKKTQAQDALDLSGAVLEYNSHLFEAGSITQRDLVLAQSDAATSRVNLISAQQNESSARTTLRQLLEMPRTDSMNVDAPQMQYASPGVMGTLPDFETLMSAARAHYPGLLADSMSVLAAKKEESLAHKNNSVSVSLGANATTGLQAWESDGYADQMRLGYTHSLTLGVSVPIADKGVTAAKVLQAQVASSEAEVTRRETAKTLENNMEQLYLQAVSADASWNAAILQVQAAAESFRVAEEQREAGSISYTDYLEQKNNLESARSNLTQAKYTSILARNLLDLYMGKYQ